jgi:hypothetical protein
VTKSLLWLALGLAVLALATLLLIAAAKPDTFRVERTATVQVPAERILALINDMRQFNTWNPYSRKDPAMRGRYEGPSSGPGAAYHFDGNRDVGKGSLRILDTAPHKVTLQLHMVEPFECRNTVEFILSPQGGGTQVTWAMQGPAPYVSRLMGTVFNLDRMIGQDFEAGLASLKQIAETR